jgi:hypothetical protein
MVLQLANQSVQYLTSIDEDILVKIRDLFVSVDFVVLDVNPDFQTSIILGRPLLSTANATFNVGARVIQLIINGKE